MKYCYTCGKELQPGEGVDMNGILRCNTCAQKAPPPMVAEKKSELPLSQVQRTNAKRIEVEQIFSIYPDTKNRSDKWIGILRVVAIVEMIVGMIAALIISMSFSGDDGEFGIGIFFGGVAAAIVAAAPMMVISNVAQRQEEMRVLLEKQLALQKEQLILLKEQLDPPASQQG